MIKKRHPKEKETVKALIQIKKVFEKNNLNFWLDFGTLLGAVRDKKILPWEVDVDLFLVKDKDNFDKVAAAFEELSSLGFNVLYFWERGMINLRKKKCMTICTHFLDIKGKKANFTQTKPLTFYGKVLTTLWWLLTASKYRFGRAKLIINTIVNTVFDPKDRKYVLLGFLSKLILSIVVGLFYLVPFKSKLLNIIWKLSEKSCKQIAYEIPAKDYSKFSLLSFYGHSFKVPANYKKHLATIYGNDWRKPKPNWGNKRYGLYYKKRIAKKISLGQY